MMDQLRDNVKQHDATFIMGLPSYDPAAQSFHNSLFVLGKQEGSYHKRHLVPIGEYVPLQEFVRGIFSFLDLLNHKLMER